MDRKNLKTIFSSAKKIFPLIILMVTILMGVGYASINSIIIGFNGEAVAKEIDGVYITEVDYLSDVNADLTTSKILNAYQTNLTSIVALSKTNGNSSITYQITIYNSTDLPYSYKGTEYVLGEGTYDNQSITFTVNGLNIDDVVQSQETRTFSVTFMYVNNNVAANNVLNSIINFKFEEYQEDEVLVSAGVLNSNFNDGSVFGSNLYKSTIESVFFVNHKDVPAGATSWNATEDGSDAIVGWYVDSDGDSLYELYIGADTGKITFPENCSSMFYWWGSLTSIDFSNVDTSQVTDMSNMFYYSYKITELDLRSFDTSNVINMMRMFYGCSAVTILRFDNANFDKVTSYSYTFYDMKGILVVKNDAAKTWANTAIGQSYYKPSEVLTVEEYEAKYS